MVRMSRMLPAQARLCRRGDHGSDRTFLATFFILAALNAALGPGMSGLALLEEPDGILLDERFGHPSPDQCATTPRLTQLFNLRVVLGTDSTNALLKDVRPAPQWTLIWPTGYEVACHALVASLSKFHEHVKQDVAQGGKDDERALVLQVLLSDMKTATPTKVELEKGKAYLAKGLFAPSHLIIRVIHELRPVTMKGAMSSALRSVSKPVLSDGPVGRSMGRNSSLCELYSPTGHQLHRLTAAGRTPARTRSTTYSLPARWERLMAGQLFGDDDEKQQASESDARPEACAGVGDLFDMSVVEPAQTSAAFLDSSASLRPWTLLWPSSHAVYCSEYAEALRQLYLESRKSRDVQSQGGFVMQTIDRKGRISPTSAEIRAGNAALWENGSSLVKVALLPTTFLKLAVSHYKPRIISDAITVSLNLVESVAKRSVQVAKGLIVAHPKMKTMRTLVPPDESIHLYDANECDGGWG